MAVSSATRWEPSPAHLRAVVIGVGGAGIALLFRIPELLVLVAPLLFVTVWSVAARPDAEPTLAGRVAPRTVREGEATTWVGELADVDRADHVVVFSPPRPFLESRPRSGVIVSDAHGASTATVQLPIRVTHWGRRDLAPFNVVAVSRWGAFRWKALDVGGRVTALPLPAVFDAAPAMHRADGLVGLNRSGHPGDGNEFAGLRPFQTGDRLRRINWRRSLRSGELHVTATYADQDLHVALFVDAVADFGPSDGIDGAASSLDTSVRAAGAIAEHFLLRGDRVSLRVFGTRGRNSVAPASGRNHLRRLLDVLASIEPDSDRRSTIRRSKSALPSDALAIMFSPLISPTALDWAVSLARHGLTVAVVDTLPDGFVDGADRVTELAWRIRLLERRNEVRMVEQVGVPVVAWQGPGSLDPFLREIARRSAAPRMARR